MKPKGHANTSQTACSQLLRPGHERRTQRRAGKPFSSYAFLVLFLWWVTLAVQPAAAQGSQELVDNIVNDESLTLFEKIQLLDSWITYIDQNWIKCGVWVQENKPARDAPAQEWQAWSLKLESLRNCVAQTLELRDRLQKVLDDLVEEALGGGPAPPNAEDPRDPQKAPPRKEEKREEENEACKIIEKQQEILDAIEEQIKALMEEAAENKE